MVDHQSTFIRTTVQDEPEVPITRIVMGSSSDSPLVVQEQSVHSSNAGGVARVSEIVEDLPDQSGHVSDEDVSTLNQISPLPTG